MNTSSVSAAEDEVIGFLVDLIRFAAVNTGDLATIGDGETRAVKYIQERLEEVGYSCHFVESVPGRGSLVMRIPGSDPSRGALLIHGHVDVVPADAADWSVDPFAAEIKDGFVWGRGAVDMLDMVAMMLAVARHFAREKVVPPRDLVFAFLADEEAGGFCGSNWLVDNHPEWFDGVTEAVSEVGGFSVDLDGKRRAYLVGTAEKGIAWATLTATGRAGHGSMANDDNAVTRLVQAMAAIGEYEFDIDVSGTVQTFLDRMTQLTGRQFPADNLEQAIAELGPISQMVNATLRTTANPTQLSAGYKANVIPGVATGVVDCRILPSQAATFKQTMAELAGDDIEISYVELPALESPFSGRLVDAMADAIAAEDPDGVIVPYMLSAGTDNKSFSRLGIAGYGFAPLRLPADFDFSAMFHGVDERVPVDAVKFGVRVLDRLLRTC
jgi:acetylornithine deacetylase/succinyl-diaminopimelate desuccinylase-like protein